ncbi:Cdc25 phosphatase Ibp1 [Tieghemiomyces parasiticus]|uniref:Cdc25 phosphatase Ibp1 n=1 Tax=Tieghemiomyces parasiticus TaxID=78921 RepID=A0A9W8A9P3_9FUNG|nr:Cdc25 phosphatase Ibp1 [Tieghemiomyces parasiticus]
MTSSAYITEYIDHDELARLVRDPSNVPGKDYLVIDVRTDDYAGGHIPHGLNVPAHQFRDFVPYILTNYATVPLFVVHCALSQVRGPKSARILREILADRAPTGPDAVKPQVKVLRGGITQWVQEYRNDAQLIAEFDHELWDGERDY